MFTSKRSHSGVKNVGGPLGLKTFFMFKNIKKEGPFSEKWFLVKSRSFEKLKVLSIRNSKYGTQNADAETLSNNFPRCSTFLEFWITA